MRSGDLAARNVANSGYEPIDARIEELCALRELAAAVGEVVDDLTGGICNDHADRIRRALRLANGESLVRGPGLGMTWINEGNVYTCVPRVTQESP